MNNIGNTMIPERKLLHISELNRIIHSAIEGAFPDSGVWVIGEVRQFKRHSSGTFYFALRDDSAQVDCAMWRNIAANLAWVPDDGMKVEAFGQPSIYEKTGRYQFIVRKMLPAGQGDRAIAFAMLKKKLEAQGYFDPEHKKPLPAFPFTIGVVTSRTGAALRDIVNVIERRAPWVTVICRNTKVQGDTAPLDIVRAIEDFNEFGEVDLLIVGRGGGSEEDLWCFNDESVAKVIFDSRLPIVSAVGHEVDFSIADFVADLRAPTPSAAAELAVPNRMELVSKIAEFLRYAESILSNKVISFRSRIQEFRHRLEIISPIQRVNEHRRNIDELQTDAQKAISLMFNRRKTELAHLSEKLILLSIDRILDRGFSIVWKNGKIIHSTDNIDVGNILDIQFSKGKAKVDVKETEA